MEGFGGVDYCVDGAEVVCCLIGKIRQWVKVWGFGCLPRSLSL